MKNIRFIFIFLILIFVFTKYSLAEFVPLVTAKKVAINCFNERYDKNVKLSEVLETYTEKQNSFTLYYIFNIIEPTPGFIIVSAEDATIPVLGYSFGHIYESENHPVQFDEMLSSYRKQVIYAIENNIHPTTKISGEWERLSVNPLNFKGEKANGHVSPLLSVTWNQDWPYNELCPTGSGGPGGHAYAGCVATAMAQIMKYWSHPITGTGSHGYTHYNYGYLFADFEATTYDWINMPHTISSSNILIATLMYHCGVAVEMNYGPSSSGANIDGYHGACNAFKNYFNYDLNAYHDNRYKYADSTWQMMIRNELDNGRPIVYAGWDAFTGHAWNLDGYEAVGDLFHYHMNWGWEGSFNGFYYLDDLTPGYHDLTIGQEAIFNLFPYAANKTACYPQNTNYWTGSTNTSVKTEISLVSATEPEDGWMSFDISSIPDGSVIYAVSFNGYIYDISNVEPDLSITPVTNDPIVAGADILHADIIAEQSAGYYFRETDADTGWYNIMLEGNVCTDLQSSLSSDKFTIGVVSDYLSYLRYIKFHGWNEANPPYLNVYYTAFGNIEGYITEHGTSAPIEDVYINIGHFTDTTDSNGYFYIEDVPIGSYEVYIDANSKMNAGGNPYFNDTVLVVIEDGITTQMNTGLKWAEINLNPTFVEIPIDPFEVKTESFTITNDGPGDLEYVCHVEPPMGDTLANLDIETPSGDITLYGCEFDGTNIWVTGPVSSGGDHQLYKFDKDGNLISQYSQGTTSQWGMRKMTFDGTYLYSYDAFGFYRIDINDGIVTTLFTDFPEGLYEPNGIAWVQGLGFVAGDDDHDFVVFDENGIQVTLLDNIEEIYITDLTYDNANDCLWLIAQPNYTIYQYDMETEALTGLSWLLPKLDADGFQSANGICFSTDFIENTITICGMTAGNPVNRFFALEVESWLQITGNRYGIVEASSKGLLEVIIEINAGEFTEPTKSADIVINNNAGDNSVFEVTITNNYISGSLSGFVTEFGNSNPIQNAYLIINGQSDFSDGSGYYEINNIPNGVFDLNISHEDYLNRTIENIAVTGLPSQLDLELQWTEIDISPSSFNINLSPDNTLETIMNIANTGTGDLEYSCIVTFPNKSKSPSILVVDRDLSSFYQYEDEVADEWYAYENALTNNGFSYTYYEIYWPWDNGPDLTTLLQYDIVIWFTGEIYDQECITSNDEENLASYLDSGGSLFLSSQGYLTNYGWDTFTLDPGDFPYDYLGLRTVTFSNWNVWFMGTIEGVSGSLAEGYTCTFFNSYFNPPVELSEFNDHVGTGLFNVTDPVPEGVCALQYNGNGFKSVFSTLSLASIEEPCRTNLLAEIISFLGSQWLSISSNESGIIAGTAKGSVDIGLLFDATGLAEGTYEAEIIVNSNDLDSLIIIPVTLNVGDTPGIELKVFLEGPFNVAEMNIDLNNNGLLPLSQPFNVFPWFYEGTEYVSTIPNSNIADWILIEYRDATDTQFADASTTIGRQAAFLLNDGSVVDIDGVNNPQFNNSINHQLYAVIWHRNHLGVISSNSLSESGGSYSYDFTTPVGQAYGSLPQKEISSGIWGLYSGDGNCDGYINNSDKINIWKSEAGKAGYFSGDFNMDCNVNNSDKNDVWKPNDGKGSQVPE